MKLIARYVRAKQFLQPGFLGGDLVENDVWIGDADEWETQTGNVHIVGHGLIAPVNAME